MCTVHFATLELLVCFGAPDAVLCLFCSTSIGGGRKGRGDALGPKGAVPGDNRAINLRQFSIDKRLTCRSLYLGLEMGGIDGGTVAQWPGKKLEKL